MIISSLGLISCCIQINIYENRIFLPNFGLFLSSAQSPLSKKRSSSQKDYSFLQKRKKVRLYRALSSFFWGCPGRWPGRAVPQLAGLLGPAAACGGLGLALRATAIHPSAGGFAASRRKK
ncbi:hypothetical protein SGRA_0029 [Saprospira grandis str. Lewin]|uniref:Uncharacterized protein n=1 Tax=Saprospira grandis (strain Lewin) TaxID=984262 RepID=H6L3T9_SAPGL|nr:hypothetical protein SGRA_0029 [Saprospira grandis str. Lewin]